MSSHHHHQRKRSTSPLPAAAATTSSKRAAPSFPSYLDFPELPPKIRHLCQLLHSTPPNSLEAALSSSQALTLTLTPADVESVLKLSYSLPSPAVKFFRWAGARLGPSLLTPYSWNLAVDLLGRNRLFDAMWDCVRSMRSLSLLSLATFASLFSSLAAAGRFDDALKAFDDMPSLYALPNDTPALNSLLSALCREANPAVALDVLESRRRAVLPDADTYAILLEGWEAQDDPDPRAARRTFDDMTHRLGWDPANVPAYDSFLNALLKAHDLDGVVKYVRLMTEKRCYPGMKFFRNAMAEFAAEKDAKGAAPVWDALVGRNGCFPDRKMYNEMIALQCGARQAEAAQKYLDEMVTYGVFPDAEAYDVLLELLLGGRSPREAEAASVFKEMLRNELVPSRRNCESAVKVFADSDYWDVAMMAWRCMVENGYPAEDSSNALVEKLIRFNMLPEACRLAEDMIDKRVKLSSASLSKLRTSLTKLGKGSLYDHIFRKWKIH
ncbi:putative pentatricopeptide repeat-containing protein, mitochondrial [Iris pallida]|uniref:Pentatricopeptide repeat-containing protein, mitochondrial n=1 Tax=Iris pallida TaxID=29817 RepID=A0AAX6DNV6_IRIPA|nr:putative pentatricopeptide repeat-containing protein, mitochondrial [Iris pallida]